MIEVVANSDVAANYWLVTPGRAVPPFRVPRLRGPIPAIILAALLVSESSGADRVTLRVTRAFDPAPVVQHTLPAQGNAIELLRQAARVESGTGFVTAIGDLRSGIPEGRSEDWFYFINGVVAPVGGTQYKPAPGDHIWWDFHPWSESFHVAALIGAFPQPFVGGYAGRRVPTRILFAEGFQDAAEPIASLLRNRGAEAVASAPLPLSAEHPPDLEKYALLLLGPWSELSKNKDVASLHREADRTGCLIEFGPSGVSGRTVTGTPRHPEPAAGAIVAVRAGARPGSAVWLVTGTGPAETRAAAALMATRPSSLLGLAGLLLVDGRIVTLPLP